MAPSSFPWVGGMMMRHVVYMAFLSPRDPAGMEPQLTLVVTGCVPFPLSHLQASCWHSFIATNEPFVQKYLSLSLLLGEPEPKPKFLVARSQLLPASL